MNSADKLAPPQTDPLLQKVLAAPVESATEEEIEAFAIARTLPLFEGEIVTAEIRRRALADKKPARQLG